MYRILIILLFVLSNPLFGQVADPAGKKPSIGAIYWGMWNSYGFGNPAVTEVTLNPPQYRDRVPFFGRESTERVVEYIGPPQSTRHSATTSLKINGDQQWVVDQEIKYAVDAGIDYFAYIYYGKNHYSHRLYKTSNVAEKQKLKMAWIIGFLNEFDIPDLVSDMDKDFYQTVLNDRPVLYFLKFGEDCLEVANFLDRVKEEYVKQFPSSPLPYVVILNDGNPDAHYCNHLGKYYADAFGAYVSLNGGSLGDHSYEYIRDKEIDSWRWGDISGAGQKRVLWMSLGFDRRPRIDYPVPWERTPEGTADPGNSRNWAGNATPVQIEEQLQRAVKFVNENPQTCETQSILLYAWNEHDEGGWISPTIVPGTNSINSAHLRAVKKGLTTTSPCSTVLSTPYLSHTTPLSVKEGERTTITANCETGSPVWNTGLQGKDMVLDNPVNTTYQVKCKTLTCESEELFIDINVISECSEIAFDANLYDIKPQDAVSPTFNKNFEGKSMIMNGVNFTDIFKGGIGSLSGTELTFDLGFNHGYGFLTGVVGLDQTSNCKDSKVKFYLRDKVSMDFLFTSKEISFDTLGNTLLDTFKIDVRKIRYLRMDTQDMDGEKGCALVNWSLLKLECPPDCEADSPPVLVATPKIIKEGESVTIEASCEVGEVVWEDGIREKVRIFSPRKTTSYSARCITFGCDGSPLSDPLEVKVNVNCDLPHHVNYYKSLSTDSSVVNIGKNGNGDPLRLIDGNGEVVEYDRGFGSLGVGDIHFDLTEKREFRYFKVRVGIDPSDTCAGPVRFRVFNMIEKEDMLTSPVIYPVGKGTPNYYDMEVLLDWMLWFNLQILPENPEDSCGLFNWIDPRYECYSNNQIINPDDPLLSLSEDFTFNVETYPNPSSGSVRVKVLGVLAKESEMKLVDNLGRVHHQRHLKHDNDEKEVLIENIESGKYILSVTNKGRIVSKAVVVY
jgi:hypothetical protein